MAEEEQHDAHMESDEEHTDEEGEEGDQPGQARGMRMPVMMPLEFLQLLAGRRFELQDAEHASDNAGLVNGLRRSGMLSSDSTFKAMMECPRASFVPTRYKNEANYDSPIRVSEHDFNISAPHMHAQMLDSMDLQPGDRVLDVGCGCGILAACAAYMVGKQGTVCGVDTKEVCVDLSRTNVEALRRTNPKFATAACDVTFRKHNIFLLARKLKGQFNKVMVGATCPENWVAAMFDILPETGGLLMVPVDTDLRLYIKTGEGKAKSKVVSSVRFQDLEVPTQSAVVLNALTEEQQARLHVEVSPSTLMQDLNPEGRAKAGCAPLLRMCSSCCSPPSTSGSPPLRHPSTTSTSSSSSSSSHGISYGADAAATVALAPAGPWLDPKELWEGVSSSNELGGKGSGRQVQQLGLDQHGGGGDQPDFTLVGEGWTLRVHKAVLRARCQHFKAQVAAGMRDVEQGNHLVADDFSRDALLLFLHYLYLDELPPGVEPLRVAELARVSSYYGTPRLSELCEHRLAEELLHLDPEQARAEAPALLQLASNLGLQQLARMVAAFCAQHYEEVRQGEAYRGLGPEVVDLITQEVVRELNLLKQMITGPLDGGALPHPTEAGYGSSMFLRRIL